MTSDDKSEEQNTINLNCYQRPTQFKCYYEFSTIPLFFETAFNGKDPINIAYHCVLIMKF